MEPKSLWQINKEVWYNPGEKILIRDKADKPTEYTVVDCYWNTVVLTNGKYNFCVQKVDIYYRLPVEIRD